MARLLASAGKLTTRSLMADRLLPDGFAELFRLLAAVAEAPLGRLAGRVTVARGDADQPVNIASADRLAAALGMTVTVLAGCGHTPMLRDAAAVAALIDGALAPRLALAS